ncbi:uncharacterized protein SOCEGT47_009500 [Sorangium cellulosum]|uniref:Addiction module protein n=1 Tax=Sorangium cellulosum TaxID=56 RepID=A0A4P2PV22_SORCE|nr:addiction module protein [Sorangium cellulosum]AUX20478.1 uncharacterized protein SOCEGT47_009500 [Sorangium cellulosum]
MIDAAERILHEALELSEQERVEIAAELLSSLGPPDLRSDEDWIAEIERRASAAGAGSPGIPWGQARAELERELGRW